MCLSFSKQIDRIQKKKSFPNATEVWKLYWALIFLWYSISNIYKSADGFEYLQPNLPPCWETSWLRRILRKMLLSCPDSFSVWYIDLEFPVRMTPGCGMEYSFCALFVVFMPQVQFRFKLFSYSSVILDQQNNLIFKDLGSSYFFFFFIVVSVQWFTLSLCFVLIPFFAYTLRVDVSSGEG